MGVGRGEFGNCDSQRLGVGGEPREADVELVVDLKHPLEVGRDGLKLHAQPPVAGDREAVLPHHRHHGGSIVLEDLRCAGGEPVRNSRSEAGEGRHGGLTDIATAEEEGSGGCVGVEDRSRRGSSD